MPNVAETRRYHGHVAVVESTSTLPFKGSDAAT